MSVKLRFGDPVVVDQGPTLEEVGWGPYQFPAIRRLDDGRIVVRYDIVNDSTEDYGLEKGWSVSEDEGKSWRRVTAEELPRIKARFGTVLPSGKCIREICFMPDGSMITLLRTGSDLPSYLARSIDGGHSWTKPVKFDKCGVLPMLLPLKCGVTLASYGRPGRYIRATTDPSGLEWEKPYMLDPPVFPRRICYYHEMLEIDERTAMLAYTDFHVKDRNGMERKSILVRTIHVE